MSDQKQTPDARFVADAIEDDRPVVLELGEDGQTGIYAHCPSDDVAEAIADALNRSSSDGGEREARSEIEREVLERERERMRPWMAQAARMAYEAGQNAFLAGQHRARPEPPHSLDEMWLSGYDLEAKHAAASSSPPAGGEGDDERAAGTLRRAAGLLRDYAELREEGARPAVLALVAELDALAPVSVSPDGEGRVVGCDSCGEVMPRGECSASRRPCGHHCNCSWTQDRCCWCGAEFGEGGEIAAGEGDAPARELPPFRYEAEVKVIVAEGALDQAMHRVRELERLLENHPNVVTAGPAFPRHRADLDGSLAAPAREGGDAR